MRDTAPSESLVSAVWQVLSIGALACVLAIHCVRHCCRDILLQGASTSRPAAEGKETEATAELDNKGLLQLQQHVMRQQDQELETMEKTVINTKVSPELGVRLFKP